MLKIIGEGGTIGYRNDFVLKLNNGSLPIWLGWMLAALVDRRLRRWPVCSTMRSRRRQGLVAEPMLLWAIKSGAFTIAVVAVVGYLSRERSPNPTLKSLKGVPNVVVVILVLVVVLGYVLSRTSWGRHVYAVGGNAEAARRAGINVAWVKISLLHHVFHDRRGRGHPGREPDQLGLADDRWQRHAAVRRRRGGHRRHQPLRWQGPDHRRRHRRPGGRGDPQRHGSCSTSRPARTTW